MILKGYSSYLSAVSNGHERVHDPCLRRCENELRCGIPDAGSITSTAPLLVLRTRARPGLALYGAGSRPGWRARAHSWAPGGKRELVVRLALESDREGQALLRVLLAAHSAPEVGRLAIHMIEDIHHRPDVRLDAVARPVLPRRHVDQQPAHGSTATATNLRASTAPTWSTRGPTPGGGATA